MAFEPGHKFAKGRPKGVPNKTSSVVKDNIMEVFKGIGGVERMIDWARANPNDFYCKIYTKLIPLDMKGAFTGNIVLGILQDDTELV